MRTTPSVRLECSVDNKIGPCLLNRVEGKSDRKLVGALPVAHSEHLSWRNKYSV